MREKKTFDLCAILLYINTISLMFYPVFKSYSGLLGSLAIYYENYKIKFIVLLFICLILMIDIIYNKKSLFPNNIFKKEFLYIIFAISSLAIITFFKQVSNGFRLFSITELLYLITPLLFVVILISCDYKKIEKFINTLFYLFVILFVLKILPMFSFELLKTISIKNSYSPFESGFSNMLIYFELYFLSKKEYKKALVSYIIVFLSLKRVSVLLGLLLFIVIPILRNRKTIKVSSKVIILSIISFILMPYIMMKFYDVSTYNYLYNNYNIDLNEITLSRYSFTQTVINNKDEIKYGLGSVTDYLSTYWNSNNNESVVNLHCDILKLYLECGILGTIIFVFSFFKITKINIFSYFVVLITFLDLLFNHALFGGGLTQLWIIIYILIIYFNFYYMKSGEMNEL